MRKTDPLEYLPGRRKRRRIPRHPGEHKGTGRERLELIVRDADAYGRISPVADYARQPFGRKMYDFLANEDLLCEALKSLKGEAAGADGIRPGDIGRYAAYRQWLVDTGQAGGKHPAFTDTMFASAPLRLLVPLLACGRKEDLESWCRPMFSGKAVYCNFTDDWYKGQPANVLLGKDEAAVEDFFLEARRHDLHPTRAKSDSFVLDHGVTRGLLRRAGVDANALLEVARCLKRAVEKVANHLCTIGGRIYVFSLFTMVFNDTEKKEDLDASTRKHLDWFAMRWIADLLRKTDAAGHGFKPCGLRRLAIPKPDGGERVLSIPTAVDRVVSRAVVLLLGPMFEQVFLPCSVGCRLELNRFDALAGLWRHYAEAPGKHILCADIRKAFDHVPHAALLEVLGRFIGNPRMRLLLERIVRRPGFEEGTGIPQGDPLSPLFLNILLHECLDKPLLGKLVEDVCYYRYVDDLCLFGLTSREEGLEYIETMQTLLAPIGLSLHPAAEPGQNGKQSKTQIVDLAVAPAEWGCDAASEHEVERYLGLGMRGGASGELEFFLTPSWQERARTMFQEAEVTIRREGYAGKKGAYAHIQHAAESWLQAFSPAWTPELALTVPAELAALARDVSTHAEELDVHTLMRIWQAGNEWWQKKCRQAESVTPKIALAKTCHK